MQCNDFYRSTRPEAFLGKAVLKICSKVTGKHTCRSVISIKLQGNFIGEHPCRSMISIKLQSNFIEVISIKLQSNFIEITLWHGCSPANLVHIFRTPFPKNTFERLLLLLFILPENSSQNYGFFIPTSSLIQ